MSIKTVAELIECLQKLPPDMPVISTEPSTEGVVVVPQNTGSVLVASAKVHFKVD